MLHFSEFLHMCIGCALDLKNNRSIWQTEFHTLGSVWYIMLVEFSKYVWWLTLLCYSDSHITPNAVKVLTSLTFSYELCITPDTLYTQPFLCSGVNYRTGRKFRFEINYFQSKRKNAILPPRVIFMKLVCAFSITLPPTPGNLPCNVAKETLAASLRKSALLFGYLA